MEGRRLAWHSSTVSKTGTGAGSSSQRSIEPEHPMIRSSAAMCSIASTFPADTTPARRYSSA